MKLSILVAWQFIAVTFAQNQRCYDENGNSKYCSPERQLNIAAGGIPKATSTCGLEKHERVCHRAGAVGGQYVGACSFCNNSELSVAFITDDEVDTITYWQSQTYGSVQYPNSVNVTVSLGKTFTVDNIRIVFQSSRPESFTLLASVDYGDTFQPIHYFSRSCRDTYGVDEGAGSSDSPRCSSNTAQVLPLTGGTVSFAATEFKATDIMIKLDRLNTFGDEHTMERAVLESYYYAISDVAISGTCFCNGHASSCSQDSAGQLQCDCAHNTTGRDCNECLPHFDDLEWHPATEGKAFECKACECNSEGSENSKCDRMTGQCLCRDGYYGLTCQPCGCDTTMTVNNSPSCDDEGKCKCVEGVIGNSCNDRCPLGYYRYENQCLSCDCGPHGSTGVLYDPSTGQCPCKDQVISRDYSIRSAGLHRVEEGRVDCPECYNDVLLEYFSTETLLEELAQTINSSLNTIKMNSDLLDIVSDLHQILQYLVGNVSELSAREMELETRIMSTSADVEARETMISVFLSVVENSETISKSSTQRVISSSNITLQISEVVKDIAMKLTRFAQDSLKDAQDLVSELHSELEILVDTASQSEQTSLEQEILVMRLLKEATEVLSNSTVAYSTLCSLLESENTTRFLLKMLRDTDITVFDLLHSQSQEELSQAVVDASSSLNKSINLHETLDGIFVPGYDPNALIKKSEEIDMASSLLIDEGESNIISIETYRQNFTDLNSTVHELFKMAASLNATAQNLTMRAHAARAWGKDSVFDAEEIINQTNFLLQELNKLLVEVMKFVDDLKSLLRTIEEAEKVSAEAQAEALSQKTVLLGAFETANETMKLLFNAALNIQTAAETAAAAMEDANNSLTNAETLSTEIDNLANAANDTEQDVLALKERADRDSQAITRTEEVASNAESNVSAAVSHMQHIADTLNSIRVELSSVELISEQRFKEIMSTLENFNVSLSNTDAVLKDTQDGVVMLEQQFAILQERYTTLLQHRDLLKDILESISNLDCYAEFF